MRIADKLTAIAENEQKVYDAGKQAERDYFWDNFQQNGTRTNYENAFYNWDMFEHCFKPKYDIKPTGSAEKMFANVSRYISIPTLCEAQSIALDFSGVTSFTNILSGAAIYRIGVVDCNSTTSLNMAFNNATSLTTIDKLIVHEGITTYNNCFANSINIQNITIEGVIAGTGFNVQNHTKLTHDSLMSIINALKDYSGTTTTKTITLGAANLAKLTDAEKVVATQKGWTLA